MTNYSYSLAYFLAPSRVEAAVEEDAGEGEAFGSGDEAVGLEGVRVDNAGGGVTGIADIALDQIPSERRCRCVPDALGCARQLKLRPKRRLRRGVSAAFAI